MATSKYQFFKIPARKKFPRRSSGSASFLIGVMLISAPMAGADWVANFAFVAGVAFAAAGAWLRGGS